MATSTIAHSTKKRPKNYFAITNFLLKLGGIDIEGNSGALYKIYAFFGIFFFNVMYIVLGFWEFSKQEFEVIIVEMFTYTFGIFMSAVKGFVAFRRRKEIAELLKGLEQEPFLPNPARGGELEETLIRECVWITNAQAIVYWIAGWGSILGTNIVILLKRLKSDDYHDWRFPYGPLTALDVTRSPTYEISWIYQGLSLAFAATQFIGTDLTTAAVLAHVSYQFKILQGNLRRLLRISHDKMLQETGSTNMLQGINEDMEIDGSAIPWKYLKRSLTETVKYHLAILKVTEKLEALMTNLLLAVFLGTLGILCSIIYRISLISLDDPKIWFSAAEAMAGCLQVATVCYWGEQVIFQSQEVGRAAFESNFVGTDLRFQRSLVLIIRRSRNPSKLTAGKFSAIALSTLVWIFRTTYSAFMVLRSGQH